MKELIKYLRFNSDLSIFSGRRGSLLSGKSLEEENEAMLVWNGLSF